MEKKKKKKKKKKKTPKNRTCMLLNFWPIVFLRILHIYVICVMIPRPLLNIIILTECIIS